MPEISKCPCCGSERLLEGKMDASFEVPDPVFRFTFDDSPSVGLLRDVGTACLDCGTVIAKANPVHLQTAAARWMRDGDKKRALRLD
jgi:RNA polymerase subunit RPABC4/transcription elongation factor Spt4